MKLQQIGVNFIVIVAILSIFMLVQNQLFGQSKLTEQKISNNQSCNYFDLNDDNTILSNKLDYYKLPDSKHSIELPTNLQGFLINHYPDSINNYGYACSQKNPTCSKENSEFRTNSIDLNNDGNKEYIVMPWKVCDCSMRGASGNGDILIVRAENNSYKIIGNLSNSNGYVVSKKKANGYSDILTNSHGSYATGTETLWKYQVFSNGAKTKGQYEHSFTKSYDLSRVKK